MSVDPDPYEFRDDDDEEAEIVPGPIRSVASSSSSSASFSVAGKTEEDESMDQLTARAIQREVTEMNRRRRERDKELESEEEASSDEGIALEDKNEAEGQSEHYPEGMLVWARIRGYSYWPGVVTVDPMDGLTVKYSEGSLRTCRVHVHFIGYPNQRAWVPQSGLMDFTGRAAYERRAAQARGTGAKKDFTPSKKLEGTFKGAIETAESVMPLPHRKRLERLGFVYVKVPSPKHDIRTAAEKKFPLSTSSKVSPKKRVSKEFKKDYEPKKKKLSDEAGVEVKIGPKVRLGLSLTRKKRTSSLTSKSSRPRETSPERQSPQLSSQKVSDSTPATDKKVEIAKKDDEHEFDDDDQDEPRLGSLVWGLMSSFPYWPCVVTRSPTGEYKRRAGKSGSSQLVHVQFFNWNNERGWVHKTLPWCSMEEFHKRAKTISKRSQEWKRWHPQGKHMVKKWTEAYEEAAITASVSRKDRYHQCLVYKSPRERKFASKNPKNTSSALKNKQTSSSTNQSQQSSVQDEVSSSPPKQKPCPKSKQPSLMDRILTQDDLPAGWQLKRKDNLQLVSPDGAVHRSVKMAVAWLFSQNVVTPRSRRKRSFSVSSVQPDTESLHSPGWFISVSDSQRYITQLEHVNAAGSLEGHYSYLNDSSLPVGWRVRRSGPNKKEFLPPGSRGIESDDILFSKVAAAKRVEPRGHPALELETLLDCTVKKVQQEKAQLVMNVEDDTDKDGGDAYEDSKVSVDLSISTSEDFADHLILAKAMVPVIVEVAKLPSIFLGHPTVKVEEKANEMIITDVHTKEFIAKKIMYF